MKNLYEKLTHLFPNAPDDAWSVERDGDGQKISEWNLAEPQPTEQELAQITDAAALAAFRNKNLARLMTPVDKALLALIAELTGTSAQDTRNRFKALLLQALT